MDRASIFRPMRLFAVTFSLSTDGDLDGQSADQNGRKAVKQKEPKIDINIHFFVPFVGFC
jgi:hypothetical protein